MYEKVLMMDCDPGSRSVWPVGMRPPTCTGMLWRIPPVRSGRSPPAGFIQPCQPTLVAHPPAGPGWLHEMRHDGYRLLASKAADRVTLWSRYGTDFTSRLPAIAEAVRALPVGNALIDGEAVVFQPDGHSDFAALRTKAGGEQASFVAFDLLSLDDDDLKPAPLEERREALEQLVADVDDI
jgi:bifunctional non-homologous end joining protein LigD